MEMDQQMIKRESGQYDLELVQRVSLKDQFIRVISNTQQMINLRDLDLSFNEITTIQGLAPLVALQRLDLSHNKIRVVQGLETLSNLRWLDISYNKIETLQDTCEVLKELPALKSLKIGFSLDDRIAERGAQLGAAANNTSITNTAAPQGNVCCKHPKYPLCIFDYLPTLTVLDGSLVELLREAAMDAALSQVKQGDSSAGLTEADILAADNWLLGSGNAADSAPAPALVLDPSASAANVTSTQKAISLMLKEDSSHLLRKADKILQDMSRGI